MGHIAGIGEVTDEAMMMTPRFWPLWPMLPIKKDSDVATLYETTKGRGNILFIPGVTIFAVSLSAIEAATIADIPKLIAEGWIVD